MGRNPEYKFVPTAGGEYVDKLITKYREITGRTINPADPERLFLAWMADIIINEKINQNYIGNQNIPSRADGENLDALGEMIYFTKREGSKASTCTVRFHLSTPAPEIVIIPAGVRVTDNDKVLVWSTVSEVIIPIGEEYADSAVICATPGSSGNGYIPGQINNLVDVDKILYNTSVENIDTTYGGADVETDDEYYTRMRDSLEALSVAGPSGAYEYHAKTVSDEIADVKAIRPRIALEFERDVYKNTAGEEAVFIGGDGIVRESVTMNGEAESPTSFTLELTNGILKAIIPSTSSMSNATAVRVNAYEDSAARVHIYALMKDGSIADGSLKDRILAACSDEEVRPLADLVTVQDANAVGYTIDFDYFISNEADKSYADIKNAVDVAVDSYIRWQRARFGRDINPSYLYDLLMHTGIKRCEIREPKFARISDGRDGTAPQYARFDGDTSNCAVFGGYEDE